MWNQEVLWLPDSSGWSVLHSAEGPAELYRVDTLANGPKLLPLPAKRVDTLLGRRRDGSWLWLPEGSNSVRALRFLATKSPAPAPLTIPGDPTATLRWPYALHTNTDTLAVTVERRNNWWGKFLKQEEITELCVFSLTSGSVSRLPLPDKLAYVRSLQWSPDGKHLLCLLDSQTASNAPIVSKTYLFSQ